MMMTRSRSSLIGTTLALVALASPMAVFANEPDTIVQGQRDRRVATVRYADINLASTAGIEALRARVLRVAKSVCIDYGSRDLRTMIDGQSCVKAAVAGAEPQIARAAEAFANRDFAAQTAITVRPAS
jgi:UrcA family protein